MKYLIAFGLFCIFINYANIQLPKDFNLENQLVKLETAYNNKLLLAHGINPEELKSTCTTSENPKLCEKNYIMEKTGMSEKDYRDIFVHPLSQILAAKNTTIKDIKTSFNEFKDKYKELETNIKQIFKYFK